MWFSATYTVPEEGYAGDDHTANASGIRIVPRLLDQNPLLVPMRRSRRNGHYAGLLRYMGVAAKECAAHVRF